MDGRTSARCCRTIVTTLVAATIVFSFAAAELASQDAKAPRAIRGLYVTGGGFHDFVTQETIVPPGIAQRIRVEWTIDHTAG